MPKTDLILVSTKVLPSVFPNVIKAKELLASGSVKTTAEAVRIAGISRSAFYKYKDYVFKCDNDDVKTVSISALLADRSGVFSSLTAVLCKYGVNIITINQNMPIDGTAAVYLTLTTKNLKISLDELITHLTEVDGVITAKIN
ncbi:MAG: ACT domain-containing protein [Clostridia bacterium]|nr:ACT domain-containing protein [Clostridia bacterium]MBQ2135709.1 ACT domain-containing protein [Clostridia bacterium]MBQ2237554.1 ACT domain-containing protein [Clostridia bacterium]MEE1184513.1 ACT domain-containing protein [Acutalibacteraceae bacterium]